MAMLDNQGVTEVFCIDVISSKMAIGVCSTSHRSIPIFVRYNSHPFQTTVSVMVILYTLWTKSNDDIVLSQNNAQKSARAISMLDSDFTKLCILRTTIHLTTL